MASYTEDIGSSWDNFAKAMKDMQTGLLLGSNIGPAGIFRKTSLWNNRKSDKAR